jgi:hypothetical protein
MDEIDTLRETIGHLTAENETLAEQLRKLKLLGIDLAAPGSERTILGMHCRTVPGMTTMAVIPAGVDVRVMDRGGKPYALLHAPWMRATFISLTGNHVQQLVDDACRKPG